MSNYEQEQRVWLQGVLQKINTITDRGLNIIERIPELIKRSQESKLDPADVRAMQVDERVLKRRYGTKLTAEMANVSHSSIYTAEQDGRLPEPDYRTDTKRRKRAGYTINQISAIRKVFNTLPSRPEGTDAAIIGVLNLKGGSQKTTMCHLFSQYLAIQGYRVLVVDTDPQGSLSFYYGKRPDVDVQYENTIAPFLLEDDEALEDAGFGPNASLSLKYAIQPTYWDGVDIIPACLQNLNIDMAMPSLLQGASKEAKVAQIEKLRNGLQAVGQDYDFILLDGTPSLNITTLNVITACDMVFVPTPAAMSDYASTLQFAQLIADTIDAYDRDGFYPNIPDLRFVITKYSKSSYAQFMEQVIRKTFGVETGDVLTKQAHHSDEIGKATNRMTSIYEVNPSEADNRTRLRDTVKMFDGLFAEMTAQVISTCWGDLDRQPYRDKFDDIAAMGELVAKTMEKESTE